MRIEGLSKALEGKGKEPLKEKSWLHVGAALGDGKKPENRKVGVIYGVCLDCVRLRVIDALHKAIEPFLGMFILQEGNQCDGSVAEQVKNWIVSISPGNMFALLDDLPSGCGFYFMLTECTGHDALVMIRYGSPPNKVVPRTKA
jgi:hypothetical protein